MCAIAWIIEKDVIHLYSDGYSKEVETGAEIWDHSKIHPIDSHTAMLSMGYWSDEVRSEVISLRGSPEQIAHEASQLLRDYFYGLDRPQATKLHVFGFESGKSVVYSVNSDDNFDVISRIPANWPFEVTPALGVALNGLEEHPQFGSFVLKAMLHNPTCGLGATGISSFLRYDRCAPREGYLWGEIVFRNAKTMNQFDELKREVQRVCRESGIEWRAGWINKEIDRAMILAESQRLFKTTGHLMTKELCARLAGETHLSEDAVRCIVYRY